MQASRWFGLAARVALGVFAAAGLVSCGSGAVSGPAVSTGAIVVSPSTAVLYSELPTVFTVTGGNGTYIVTSSDQNVLPVADVVKSNLFYVVPNDVGTDTPVTLTVRDNANSAAATASLTVKPRTIGNAVTITPSAGQSAACGGALCSGGDAEVKVVLSQLGVPLSGRTVQFDVVSGDLKIISSSFAGSEVLTTTATAVTDSTGTARIRVRANSDAVAQTAILKITDLSSGFTQTAAVSIASSTSTTISVLPSNINFTGTTTSTCANGVSADVIVVGGRPPYQVTKPAGFTINPTVLTFSGGHITVTATGQCARTGSTSGTTTIPDGGQVMTVVDSNGANASVTIHNDPAPVTAVQTNFDVQPNTVTLDSCFTKAQVTLVGGSGQYFSSTSNSAVNASITYFGFNGGAGQGTISRVAGTPATSAPAVITFTDGQTIKPVTVNLVGAGAGACP